MFYESIAKEVFKKPSPQKGSLGSSFEKGQVQQNGEMKYIGIEENCSNKAVK